jgi:tRNA (guanine26-N2/guanine27-N2)-dimethyltransferase
MYFSDQNKFLPRKEGQATFLSGGAFYRAHSRLSRDLGVLAAIIYRRETGKLRVLDGMTAAGVRSLRYALEAQADFVWANDGNPEIAAVLEQNLRVLDPERYCVSYGSAHRLLSERGHRSDYFDLIDLDAFGSPISLLPGCFQAVRHGGLLYLTSTDGRSISGQLPEQSLRNWGAWVRSHPAVQEQAIRLLLGLVAQQAAMVGLGIEPVFSLYRGQSYRVMVQVFSQQTWRAARSGFLGYCHTCGNFRTLAWSDLGKAVCCGGRALSVSGPLWLGTLHGDDWLSAMAAESGGEAKQILAMMQQENALPPYYYPLGEIGRRGKLKELPKRDRLIEALQSAGYRASPTHLDASALKTDASLGDCLAIARSLGPKPQSGE